MFSKGGSSDPFATLELEGSILKFKTEVRVGCTGAEGSNGGSDGHTLARARTHTHTHTQVQKKSLDPLWQETFAFPCDVMDPTANVLDVMVEDWDLASGVLNCVLITRLSGCPAVNWRLLNWRSF